MSMSVRLNGKNSAPTRRILVKFDVLRIFFFGNLSRKFNLTRITGTLLEDRYTFLIISRSVLLRVRNVSDKSHREKTHILCSINFYPPKHAFYEIIWKNMVQPDRSQMAV
jgi:hypothetical protein